MKLSDALRREKEHVKRVLTGVICARCGATLETYAQKCFADLSDPCDGFMAIEHAKDDFHGRPRSTFP